MWLENEVFRTDLAAILSCPSIPWERLKGRTVFVTGATGLIGFNLICALLYANQCQRAGIKVLALVRDLAKARRKFLPQLEAREGLQLVQGTVEALPEITEPIDYIVHGASPTDSAYFAQKPVETALTIVRGTCQALELARQKRVRGFVFLSSMEVYGAPQTDAPIYETFPTAVNTMSTRSAYPQAKLLGENLCAAYAGEYRVPAMVLRLAQTFGAGVERDNGRVFAQFARAAVEGVNIVLKTEGASRRSYLYTADAVTALLTVLLAGTGGEAYNAANPQTYCSVLEMAELVAKEVAGHRIGVEVQLAKDGALLYPPSHKLNLQVEKLSALGWQPQVSLLEMYQRMIATWQQG